MRIQNQPNTIQKNIERTLFFVAREAGEAMANDPALALRTSATMMQGMIMDGVGDSVREGYQKTIVPTIRTALLALNTARCVQTFKNPNATKFDRTMDAIRVASDLVGFVGGVAMLCAPQYASLGSKLVGVSYAADVVSHAYRGLGHADRRIKFWAQLHEQQNTPSEPKPPKQDPPKQDPPKS